MVDTRLSFNELAEHFDEHYSTPEVQVTVKQDDFYKKFLDSSYFEAFITTINPTPTMWSAVSNNVKKINIFATRESVSSNTIIFIEQIMKSFTINLKLDNDEKASVCIDLFVFLAILNEKGYCDISLDNTWYSYNQFLRSCISLNNLYKDGSASPTHEDYFARTLTLLIGNMIHINIKISDDIIHNVLKNLTFTAKMQGIKNYNDCGETIKLITNILDTFVKKELESIKIDFSRGKGELVKDE